LFPSRRQLVLLLGDLALIEACAALALAVRFLPSDRQFLDLLSLFSYAILIFTGVHFAVAYVLDLYNASAPFPFVKTLRRLVIVEILAMACAAAVFFFVPEWTLGRGLLALQAGALVPALALWRQVYARFLRGSESGRATLILGSDDGAKALIGEMRAARETPFHFVGVLDGRAGSDPLPPDVPVLGAPEDLDRVIVERGIRTLVLSSRGKPDPALLERVLQARVSRGIEVLDLAGAFKRVSGKIPVDHVDLEWFVHAAGFETVNHPFILRVQRIVDIGVSAAVLAILFPLLALCAGLVKLTSRGTAFYRQARVGLQGKPFQILKFRTMVADAEASTGAVFACRRDPRVIPVGRFLRRCRLDELPQFWNVLKGEMSLIGPRPERPDFVEKYLKEIPFYALRLAVKPGLTGWAQVSFPYAGSDSDNLEKLKYDLYYIQEMSLPLNLVILLKTLRTVVSRPGR
jgi:exopolysaccharide biosynthesis polyprenyl glycosylphosphotransferase